MAQGEVWIKSVGANPDHFVTGAPNADVTITLASARARHEFAGCILWSYSDTPTGGRLTVTGGGFNLDVDIIAGGPDHIPFSIPQHAMNDEDIVITLAAGGGAVVGKLNLLGVRMD